MLFTFGYEGLDIQKFIDRLTTAGVTLVLDVRELPLSRKRGFSKRAFAEALKSAGIKYKHMPALGCPKPIRNSYKEDGDWARYCRRFIRYLKSQHEAVAEIATISRKTKACLVCFEADYRLCHRSLVAQAAAQLSGCAIRHLTLRAAMSDAPIRVAA